MNKLFRKFIAGVSAFALLVGSAVPVYAQTSTIACVGTSIQFVFFNGVNTTDAAAKSAHETLRLLYGQTAPTTGEHIGYEYFYNYSNGFEDFVETFDQRLREQEGILQGRFELFFQVINGQGSWWEQIVATIVSTALVLDGIKQWLQAEIPAKLTVLFANPPTSVNYAEHRLRIDNYALEGKKMVFFAHSQGNLFVNAAADYARSKTSTNAVQVVHVAPASPTLRGGHVLADLDLVINGLRLVGSVASITNFIPGYLLRPAGLSGKKDPLGHGLLEIYVNPQLAISVSVRSLVLQALANVTAPPVQATSGFFTATLSWDGSGDVDLHAFEPGGSHVYYASTVGQVGYLDHDNVTAFGPEHYFASCDTAKLQTGVYEIRIANYNAADGRTATVQIASSRQGVLGTKTQVLGARTGSTPVYSMFFVVVTKDPTTGLYFARLQ